MTMTVGQETNINIHIKLLKLAELCVFNVIEPGSFSLYPQYTKVYSQGKPSQEAVEQVSDLPP